LHNWDNFTDPGTYTCDALVDGASVATTSVVVAPAGG
jgi:hypothetical protein